MTKQEFFTNMVFENVKAGFIRGQKLFQESLNEDLNKSSILENIQLEGYVDALLENYNAKGKE